MYGSAGMPPTPQFANNSMPPVSNYGQMPPNSMAGPGAPGPQFNGVGRPPMPGMPPMPGPPNQMGGMPPGQAPGQVPGQQFMGAPAAGPAQPRRLDPDQMPSPVRSCVLVVNMP